MAGHNVVSCMDPQGRHEWRGQRLPNIPAYCVAPEQQASLPGQPACTASTSDKEHWGMDLVWQFLSQYRRVETP